MNAVWDWPSKLQEVQIKDFYVNYWGTNRRVSCVLLINWQKTEFMNSSFKISVTVFTMGNLS